MTSTTPPPGTHVCPDPLTQIVTVEMLAARLGVRPGTIRQHLSAGTAMAWLPQPDGRINGGAVWRESSLTEVEAKRLAPGRPKREAAAPAPAQEAVTEPRTAAPVDGTVPSAGWWDAPSQ